MTDPTLLSPLLSTFVENNLLDAVLSADADWLSSHRALKKEESK